MIEHEPWHPEAFLQNRYTRAYRALVERVQAENRTRVTGEHAEHHIVPESFFVQRTRPGPPGWILGNPEDPSNLVMLTHKEHAWCHVLLSQRMTWGRGKAKMARAASEVLSSLKAAGKPYRLSSRLWASIMRESAAALAEPNLALRDTTVRTWAHVDGRVFTGSIWELRGWADLPRRALNSLTGPKPKRTAHGWRIVKPGEDPDRVLPPRAQPSQRDTTVRTWAHVDGRIFIGTRWELEVWAGLGARALGHLTKGKPRRTANGWRIVSVVAEKSENGQTGS